MAKDNDIISVLFSTLLDLIGWIFKTIFKVVWWIISTIFKAIFGKKNQEEERVQTQNGDDKQYSYEDCLNDLKNAEKDYTGEKLKDHYLYLVVNLLLNFNMSIEQKCRLLEFADMKITSFYGNDKLGRADFYLICIESAFKFIDQLLGGESLMVSKDLSDFTEEIKTGTLSPLKNYFGKIMGYAGAIGSSGDEFVMEYAVLDQYKLPVLN